MADEPETTTDAGTVTEDAAAETIEEAPVTETPADDSADGDTGEAEDDGAESKAAGETNVPYSRFKSVNERRKAAELKAAELQGKLDALTPKEVAKPTSPKDGLRGLTPADPSLSPLEQMEHYALQTIAQHPELLDKWFESKFGMPADQAAATLAHTTTTTRETIVAQFEKACGDRGLDPKNPAVQDAVGRLMDSKKYRNFGEAMDVFVKPKTNGLLPRKPVGKGAEASGLDAAGLTSAVRGILTKEEAMKLAEKNQRVPHQSITEILALTAPKG